MLKSMRKSKNRFFTTFVFPWDAPRAIKLNIVWMESEIRYELTANDTCKTAKITKR